MKTFYSINPGEFFVADELSYERRDLAIYFPFQDVGVDLLAVPKRGHGRVVRIQVKESRPWGGKPFPPHSWHQIRKTKIADADMFVFVTYLPRGRSAPHDFRPRFVIIPRHDLRTLCRRKSISKGKYTFYFSYGRGDGRVVETREDRRDGIDVTRYSENWKMVRA